MRGQDDFCSEAGAARLAALIQAYWAARGQAFDLEVINAGFNHATRACRFDVRSAMKNGWPPARASDVARDARGRRAA